LGRILPAMPGSSARQVALTLAVGAVVAGCSSGGDKPQTLPTISASPSVEASPAPSAPPASATADASAAGVEAFIKSYYAEINHAIRTGDVSVLKALSSPTCGCRQLADFIEHGNGGPNVSGGQFTVLAIQTHDFSSSVSRAEVTYDVAAAVIRNGAGLVVKRFPPYKAAKDDVSVARRGNGWIVAEVVELTK